MKNSRKAWVIFRRVILILFIIFIINYFQVESGYYNDQQTMKTILTEEKIREFEEDVKNGEFVDIKDYTETTHIDTSTPAADIGYKIGEGVNDFINNRVGGFFKYIGSFFK